jgi:Gti1/Pac2 family transcription factor
MMSGISSGSLQPTWFGHVATARDALILFEACLTGSLHHVPRRPHDRERNQLIKSGCVFIYEENASGIKRWTDGIPWSPSRILGNFLVYRELTKPFPPGEKKRAQKRPKNGRPTRPGEPYSSPRRGSADEMQFPLSASRDSNGETRDTQRALIGSLVDSYGFKEGGLVKKTMSVNLHGIHHHLVSYYSIEDVMEGTLQSPSKDPKLEGIEPRSDLVARQNFRAPIDDMDMSMQDPIHSLTGGYDYGYGAYRSNCMIGQMGNPPQPAQLGMGIYGGSGYSTGPQVQPGIQGYASVPNTQSYYAPASTLPQPIAKQENYNPYAPPYQNTHSSQLPMTQDETTQHNQTYPYRQARVPTMTSRLSSLDSSTAASDAKSLDSSDWHRTSTGSGYSSVASPVSAQSSYAPTQWSMNSISHNVARSEDGWTTASNTSQWTPNNENVASRPSFHVPSQSG